MTLLFFIASISFFIWIIRNIFFWTSLWQLKEYRLDRVFVHLRETAQGNNLLFSLFLIVKWLGIFFFGFVAFNEALLFPYQVMVSLIFLIEAVLVGKEAYEGFFKKPEFKFTAKAIFIFGTTLGCIILLYLLPLADNFLWLLLIEKTAPFISGLIVIFLAVPTEFYRDFVIQKATNVMSRRKNLLVIGVTGSFGKSSTKDYIAQILQKQFRVLKTPGTNNTPIGIANTILSGLKENTEIFVVEMGAYARGEIIGMCHIVHPKIGVITAVNHQHLSLFKDLATTMATKYELIEALPKDGIALFNGNNANAYKLAQKTKKRSVVVYSINTDSKASPDGITAYDVTVKPKDVQFSVSLRGKAINLSAPLLGSHNVENILPGIFIADYLGMSAAQIEDSVASLKPITRTMSRVEKENGLVIIDDTFNANPDAVLAAIRYMKIYKKKRILVLQPMIELGREAGTEHYRVAKIAGLICDVLLMTNNNFHSSIMKGVRDGGGKCEVRVGNARQLSEFITSYTKQGDVILFEGKEAQFVLQQI